MADGFDRFNQDLRSAEGGGGSFVMGLLTGTVLGAGLGMLFAPKAGTELRSQLSEQAANLGNTASEGARRAGESASQWAERGREMYNKASDAVAKGAEEAQKYVRETASTGAVHEFEGERVHRQLVVPSSEGLGGSSTTKPVLDRSPSHLDAMTSANARTVANVVLISAGVAAAYVVITTPPLRRLVLRGHSGVAGRKHSCVHDQSGPGGMGAVGATPGHGPGPSWPRRGTIVLT